MNVPEAVGVPEIVMVLEAQVAVTPAGKPVAVPIPVAPDVACVILVNAVLIQSVGVLEAAPAVLLGLTVLVIPVLVAVAIAAQAALDVNTTLTPSLLANVVVIKVGELVPVLVPLTFHW